MTTTANTVPTVEHGATVFIPLKKHPKNARKTPHSEASIEAKAASIAAKGSLQNLVAEPETNAEGEPTGFYLVSIGEGRRLAQNLRANRKEIKKTEPIRCVIDTANDAAEISLGENVTREDLHPADQFERFRELSEDRGWGAEEIAARFGVTAHVVKQRMRLAYHTGAGFIRAALVGFVAAFGVLVLLFDTLRSPILRLIVALVFAALVAVAGYALVHGVTKESVPSEIWRQTFCIIGGGFVGVSALLRLAARYSTQHI